MRPSEFHRKEAANEAVYRFGPPEIIDTDQRSQPTSFAWTDRLKRIGTQISMDGKGRCLDNIFPIIVCIAKRLPGKDRTALVVPEA